MPAIQKTDLIGPGVCVAVTLAAFALVYLLAGGAVFPSDDAFINLHNANVLRLGHDERYAGVPALVGATSGVHLALLMAFEQIIHPDTLALFVFGAATAAVYVLGVFGLCTNAGCPQRDAVLIALASLVLAGTLFQLLNGMDTGLAMAAVAWTIKLLTDRRRTFWLPLLCGIMPFIRPELSFLSAGAMLILLCERDRSAGFKLAAVALSAAATLPFLVWYWVDTGSFVPNTVGAKMYFFAERYAGLSTKLLFASGALMQAAVASFPLFLCLRFARWRPLEMMLALFAAVFLASFFWRFPGGLTHNGGRYLYIFAPILLFGVAGALASQHRKQALRIVAIAVLFVPLGFGAQFNIYKTHILGYRQSLADVVRWLDANLEGRPTVMVHDAGYAAYAGHASLVDLVGLKTPEATAIHAALTYPSAGRQRSEAVAGIAAKFNAQYLLAIEDWNEKLYLADGLREQGWSVEEVYAGRAPADTPKADIYRLYRLTAPDARPRTDQARLIETPPSR
jgi:hypothetical protein